MILPERVLGSDSTNVILSGRAIGPISLPTCSRKSSSSSLELDNPAFSITKTCILFLSLRGELQLLPLRLPDDGSLKHFRPRQSPVDIRLP